MRKEPGFIALCVTFGVIFVVLIMGIIFNTVHTVKNLGVNTEEPASTTEESTEISANLQHQMETGDFSGVEDTEEIGAEEDYEGKTDPPEDIEYIREDLSPSERERLNQGKLFEPMDDE